jgi:hypothetical protein
MDVFDVPDPTDLGILGQRTNGRWVLPAESSFVSANLGLALDIDFLLKFTKAILKLHPLYELTDANGLLSIEVLRSRKIFSMEGETRLREARRVVALAAFQLLLVSGEPFLNDLAAAVEGDSLPVYEGEKPDTLRANLVAALNANHFWAANLAQWVISERLGPKARAVALYRSHAEGVRRLNELLHVGGGPEGTYRLSREGDQWALMIRGIAKPIMVDLGDAALTNRVAVTPPALSTLRSLRDALSRELVGYQLPLVVDERTMNDFLQLSVVPGTR